MPNKIVHMLTVAARFSICPEMLMFKFKREVNMSKVMAAVYSDLPKHFSGIQNCLHILTGKALVSKGMKGADVSGHDCQSC